MKAFLFDNQTMHWLNSAYLWAVLTSVDDKRKGTTVIQNEHGNTYYRKMVAVVAVGVTFSSCQALILLFALFNYFSKSLVLSISDGEAGNKLIARLS